MEPGFLSGRIVPTSLLPFAVGSSVLAAVLAIAGGLGLLARALGIGDGVILYVLSPSVGALAAAVSAALALETILRHERLAVRHAAALTRQTRLQTELQLDPLTRLANRRCFATEARAAIQAAIRDDSPLALLLIDIDHFKEVNDRFGHLTGDDALVRLSDAIRATVRRTDVPARLGGDEFAVLLPQTTIGDAARAAERLRRCLAADATWPRLRVSIGAAELTSEIATLEALFHRADTALYAAKRAGRNRAVVVGSRDGRSISRELLHT